MKKWISVAAAFTLLSGSLFFACSDTKESVSEGGAIKQMTDAAAKKMVDKMLTPIDKAREAKEQQEGHEAATQEALKTP